MGNAAGEIPEIADADIVDKIAPLRVDRRDAGRSIEHVGPFRLLVPVQLAYATSVQPHVHAGDGLRNRELASRDLAGPTAARLAHMRVREGKPEILRRPGIRRRRIEHVRILKLAGDAARDGVGAADARLPARIGRRIRRMRDRCRCGGQRPTRDSGGRQDIPSGEFTRCVSIFPTLHVSLPLIVGYQQHQYLRRGPRRPARASSLHPKPSSSDGLRARRRQPASYSSRT